MIEWRLLSDPPSDDRPVMLYYSGWVFSDWSTGEPSDLGPLRNVCDRTSAGWFEGGRFFEANTGHDACESDQPWQWPTHWAALDAPTKER